jgi:hypothetical protein
MVGSASKMAKDGQNNNNNRLGGHRSIIMVNMCLASDWMDRPITTAHSNKSTNRSFDVPSTQGMGGGRRT